MALLRNNFKLILAVLAGCLVSAGAFAAVSGALGPAATPARVAPSYVTSLPASPSDGQEIYYQAGAGVIWRFRYNASSSSQYKWEFAGGPPLLAPQVTSNNTVTSTTYVTDSDSPKVTLPLAGDYDANFSSSIADNTSTGQQLFYTANTSTGAANDAQSLRARIDNGFGQSRTIRLTGQSSGAVVSIYARVTANTGRMADRTLYVRPVRVG